MNPCDLVLERFATGEPLTEDQAAHVARCVDCARLARVPRLLAATATEQEPAVGFAARMQVGARKRFAARRRNRTLLGSLAAAAVLVVGGAIVTRDDARTTDPGAMRALDEQEPSPRPPPVAETAAGTAEQVALELVRVSDVDRTLQGVAPWDEITQPLIPYRALLSTESTRKGAPR